jgi:O-antigen/teichoic acid export membrane protein
MLTGLTQQLRKRKGDLWLMSAKWTAPVLSIIGGLVAARFLAPEEFGVVQALMLIPTYVAFLQFGVFNGLNRNLPLFRAKKETERAQAYVNAAAQMARFVAIAGALIALLAVFFFLLRADDPNYAYIGLFLVVGMFFKPLRLQQETVYRGMREFERIGKNLHVSQLWVLLCSLSTSFLGITGLGIKLATQHMVGWLLLLHNPPLKEGTRASFKDIRELSAVGIPMLVSGMIFNWLSAADRTIVATFLTAEDLGYYALASIAMNALKVFPTSINTLLYPRVAHAYGAHGTSRALRRYIWIGLALNLALMLPVAVVGWFALPHVVTAFLPAYAPGIPVAQVTLVGALVFVYSGPSVIIPILRKNLPSQIMGVICLGLVWLVGTYAVSAGYGILGVAWARVIVMGCYGLFVVAYVFYLTGKDIRSE